jgi:hypothetical protein
MRKTAEQRFWALVTKSDGCWSWLGAVDKDGYGVFGLSTHVKSVRAPRHSYELCVSEIPRGLLVLHTCDNPSCVRPDHLFLGTSLDNMQDKVRKGRHVSGLSIHPECAAKGEQHGMAKLTQEAVLDIRENYVPRKTPLKVFAKKYGVSCSNVHMVVMGQTWNHSEAVHVD